MLAKRIGTSVALFFNLQAHVKAQFRGCVGRQGVCFRFSVQTVVLVHILFAGKPATLLETFRSIYDNVFNHFSTVQHALQLLTHACLHVSLDLHRLLLMATWSMVVVEPTRP